MKLARRRIPRHHRFLLFFLVLLSSLWLWLSGTIEKFVLGLGDYGYLGALVGGFFYTYGVTSPFSVVLFAALAETLNPTVAALLGGFGAMISDYLIFKSVEDALRKPITINHHKIKIPRIKSRLFFLLSIPLAAVIIGSPLPDELAAALLGYEELDDRAFLLLSFAFNSLGLFSIILLARLFV
ncbi:MAG: hypothetical protein QXF56_03120 [Candidatus Micrarchaeia archaeon]